MADSRNTAVAAVAGAVGGLAIGLFFASRKGMHLRAVLRRNIRLGTSRLEERMHLVESQLRELEESLAESRRQFFERIRTAQEPDLPEWDVKKGEVVRDLPRMPRR